jgi:hypothetical protein
MHVLTWLALGAGLLALGGVLFLGYCILNVAGKCSDAEREAYRREHGQSPPW